MINELKKVHLIGAGGIGLSAVGKLLLHQGKQVSGSDVARSEIVDDLESAGATVKIGHDVVNLAEDTGLVIYSSAVPEDNPEREAAQKQGIKQLSYFEFLGELSKQCTTIVVSGTHGKSTTTAMLGLVLEAAGLDPTVVVGTKVPGWELGNLRVGKSKYFVVEGCEYMAHMLELHPEIVALTNIEEDHLDYYRDLEHIREAFQSLVDKVPKNGFVVRNADDLETMKLKIKAEDITYSLKDKPANLKLQVPGDFNVSNALAAISVATKLGVEFSVIEKTLNDFLGVWRRFERVGQFEGAEIVSDYAHHPTAIKKTITAAKEFFPDQRVVVCFQPHQHARTRELFDDFLDAFDGVDELIVSEIYDVAGRAEGAEDISGHDLVYAIEEFDQLQGVSREVIFAEDLNKAEQELRERVKSDDVVIVMGAGDIDQVARLLVEK
jgi:UDP-N-acetylmuramate--alanine ligase